MQSRVECFRRAGCTRTVNNYRCTRGAEVLLVVPGGQCRSEIRTYRASSPSICDHHTFLHGPRILTTDEPADALGTVMFFY